MTEGGRIDSPSRPPKTGLGEIRRPGSPVAATLRWASWTIIAISFVAAAILLSRAFAAVSHQDYSHQAGRIVNVMIEVDEANTKLFDIYLNNGEYVNIYWVAGPESMVPTPLPGDFAVGDSVTATLYAGSAIDLVLDHNGKQTRYTSAYYTANGGAPALRQEEDLRTRVTTAIVAIALWVLLATGWALWRGRTRGAMVGAASLAATVAFAPYLGLAAWIGASGGNSGSDQAASTVLVVSTLVGLAALITVWSMYSSAVRRPDAADGVRVEIRRLGTLTAVGAVGWLLAVGWLVFSLAILGASCCG